MKRGLVRILSSLPQGGASLFHAFHLVLMRDVVGFGLYFGMYSFVRRTMYDVVENGRSAGNGVVHINHPEWTVGSDLQHLCENIALSSFSGAASGIVAYAWRSPWDNRWKMARGWRPPDSPLLSPRRFTLESPRGLRAAGIGAVTWAVYEGCHFSLSRLDEFYS